MPALTLMLLLLSSPLATPADGLPGDSYAIPAAGLVLRAGSSSNHAGVMELSPNDVVRVESKEGAPYVRVFVPQGFPVYLHGDFVSKDTRKQLVSIAGRRVNVRLLPATVGLLPLGQLDSSVGDLQLLDEEGDWVRVLAPVELALYAPADSLQPASVDVATARWNELMAQRDSRRRVAIAAWDATDPKRVADRRLEDRVTDLAAITVSDLSDPDLVQRRKTLNEMGSTTERDDLRQTLDRMLAELAREVDRREAAQATLLEMERKRAQEAANLVKEARALDFGLRFLGKGNPMDFEGLVTRRTSPDTESTVYSIQGPDGRQYKLSAAREVADLKALIGKRVQLKGRSLSLVNVEGAVIIVDDVAVLGKSPKSDAKP